MKKAYVFLLALTLVFVSKAQQNWSLEDCINHALENNLVILQSSLQQQTAKNNLLGNKMDLYTPEVNFSVNENLNFSNSVDPLTFEFINQNTNSTVFGLSANYTIFNGLQRINAIKASKLELDAVKLDMEELKNQTRLSVTNAFLQVLLAKDLVRISNENKTASQNQMERTQELIDAGVLAKGEIYDIKAQLATQTFNNTNAKNSEQLALLALKQILQIDPNEPFDIAVPATFSEDFDNPTIPSYTDLVQEAAEVLPNLKSVALRQQAAQHQIKQAKGTLSPVISFNANVGTNYFSAARQAFRSSEIGPVGITEDGKIVFSEVPNVSFGDLSFGQQIGQNFNERVSFSMFVPIFGKWQRMIAIDNAKVNRLNTDYQLQIKQNNLNQEVYQALTNLNNAVAKYNSAFQNNEAAVMAYNNANERVKAGLMSNFDFTTVQNRLAIAEANLSQAKYEYVFNKLILDFYQGKPLKL